MKPENTQNVTPGFESMPMPPTAGFEAVPVLPKPELGVLAGGQERFEQAAESGAQAADAGALAAATVAVPMVPVVPAQGQVPAVTPAPGTVTPLVAADEDLIEKAWVDKAKEIIEQTKDDPHARSAKVNELQRDYLQKRFGKVVGASE